MEGGTYKRFAPRRVPVFPSCLAVVPQTLTPSIFIFLALSVPANFSGLKFRFVENLKNAFSDGENSKSNLQCGQILKMLFAIPKPSNPRSHSGRVGIHWCQWRHICKVRAGWGQIDHRRIRRGQIHRTQIARRRICGWKVCQIIFRKPGLIALRPFFACLFFRDVRENP
jgi:hypothetical protein